MVDIAHVNLTKLTCAVEHYILRDNNLIIKRSMLWLLSQVEQV